MLLRKCLWRPRLGYVFAASYEFEATFGKTFRRSKAPCPAASDATTPSESQHSTKTDYSERRATSY